jgi:hypothetical protein
LEGEEVWKGRRKRGEGAVCEAGTIFLIEIDDGEKYQSEINWPLYYLAHSL